MSISPGSDFARLSPRTTRITEIFSSLQGEGPYMGQRHLFIRFEACHMACAYCDETKKKSQGDVAFGYSKGSDKA